MAEQATARVYQLLRNTYYLPLIIAWPLAVGIRQIYTDFTSKERPVKAVLGPPRKCRFPLDLDHSAVLNLPDGRKLGYAQYGALNGRAVFTTHGFPGSRLEAASWWDIAKRHNARIISVDRPGIGWSSPQPGRQTIDHARDIEQLADYLELKEYAVLGTSGGGPYAMACAAALPANRLKGVAVFVGLGLPGMSCQGMMWSRRIATYLPDRLLPFFADLMFRGDIATQLHLDDAYRLGVIREQVSKMPKHEREIGVWEDPDRTEDNLRLVLKSMRQAFGQGFDGVAQDAVTLASRDPGFRLDDIRHDLPIQLWYGKFDDHVPPVHGEQYAARLGPNAKLRIEAETHDSMQFRYQEKVLTSLLECF